MDELKFNLEMASFEEKISLAELEESKAAERVKELRYEKSRFYVQWLEMIARAQQAQAQNNPGSQVPPKG